MLLLLLKVPVKIKQFKDIAVVNYTGRTLDSGKVFDSNTDPKFTCM